MRAHDRLGGARAGTDFDPGVVQQHLVFRGEFEAREGSFATDAKVVLHTDYAGRDIGTPCALAAQFRLKRSAQTGVSLDCNGVVHMERMAFERALKMLEPVHFQTHRFSVAVEGADEPAIRQVGMVFGASPTV